MFIRATRFLITSQEKRHFDFRILFLFSVFTGIVRALEEMLFFKIPLKNSEVITFIAFYLSLGYYLTFVLSIVGGLDWKKVNLAVVIGIFLGVFPPVFDLVLGTPEPFYGYFFIWNFYELPYFGYRPEFNFPLGEAITIWLSIFFASLYIFIKTNSILRTFIAFALVYLVFILHGSLIPMVTTRIHFGVIESISALKNIDAISISHLIYLIAFWQTILGIMVFLLLRKNLSLHLLKRIPHTFPFVIICILGGSLVQANFTDIFLMSLLTLLAGMGTLVQNDWFDNKEDLRESPVEENDVRAFNYFFFLAAVFLFMINRRAVIPLVLAYAVSFLYNYPFYRARNYFPGNLKIEGVWGGSSFLAGILLAPLDKITTPFLVATFLVFGGWSLVAILKDAKDFHTDKAHKVRTIYTIFDAKGYSFQKVHTWVRTISTAALLVPVVFLGLKSSLLWGGIGFLIGPVLFFKVSKAKTKDGFIRILWVISAYILYFLILSQWGLFYL